MSSRSRFATVLLDVDSTLSGIEGIDWLASLRTADIAAKIADLTNQAMSGAISLDEVYAQRLQFVAPRRDEIEALGRAYVGALAPGSRDAVSALRDAGAKVLLISGGLTEAIVAIADTLGIPRDDVHAVGIRFRPDGRYADFDRASPLARKHGKRVVVERLGLARPILAVGDGSTDLDMKPVVDTFAAFTGFARRDPVVREASVELSSFEEVLKFALRTT